MRKINEVKLRNSRKVTFYNTTALPDSIVAQLVKFCATNLDVDRVHIEFKNKLGGSHLGFAYYGVPYQATRAREVYARNLVTVRVMSYSRYENGRHKDTGIVALESMVDTLAHELRHIHHFRHPQDRVFRGKLRNMEFDTRRYADTILKKFKNTFLEGTIA